MKQMQLSEAEGWRDSNNVHRVTRFGCETGTGIHICGSCPHQRVLRTHLTDSDGGSCQGVRTDAAMMGSITSCGRRPNRRSFQLLRVEQPQPGRRKFGRSDEPIAGMGLHPKEDQHLVAEYESGK
jgi:hypothetical protein